MKDNKERLKPRYRLFKNVHGTPVQVTACPDLNALVRAAFRMGALYRMTPVEIFAEEEQNHFADADKMVRWISVEERLPENYRVVLVIKDHPTDYLHGYEFACRLQNGEWTGFSRKVLYWMPLPEPPEVQPDE